MESKTIQNAQELLADAKLLLENGRLARSITLSLLAVEEKGKIEFIKALVLFSPGAIAKGWKEIVSDKTRNIVLIYPLLMHLQIFDIEKISKLTDPKGEIVHFWII